MKSCLSCLVVFCFCISALAGECVVTTTRTPCPGKEKESFSKCNGLPTCDEQIPAGSENECQEKAIKACDNNRPNINKSKAVSATFDGKPLQAGKNFCAADRPDYNQCEK